MAKMSGGEALVQSLVREGVEVVFGTPGIHMSGTVVALRDEPRIRTITKRARPTWSTNTLVRQENRGWPW